MISKKNKIKNIGIVWFLILFLASCACDRLVSEIVLAERETAVFQFRDSLINIEHSEEPRLHSVAIRITSDLPSAFTNAGTTNSIEYYREQGRTLVVGDTSPISSIAVDPEVLNDENFDKESLVNFVDTGLSDNTEYSYLIAYRQVSQDGENEIIGASRSFTVSTLNVDDTGRIPSDASLFDSCGADASDPCSVANPVELQSIGASVANMAKYYQQTANITMDPTTFFTPLGIESGSSFTGTYDGNSFSINRLFLDRESTNVSSSTQWGLFLTNEGAINNLTLNDTTAISGEDVVFGLVAGVNTTNGVIDNVRINGGRLSTSGEGNDTGLIVGKNLTDGEIRNSQVSDLVALVSGRNIGGIAGFNSGVVTNVSFTGGRIIGVNFNTDVGGIVGENNDGQVYDSTFSSSLYAVRNVGGVVGYNDGASSMVSGVTSAGRVVGLGGGNTVGGIIGYHKNGMVTRVSSDSDISSSGESLGGIVGILEPPAEVENCYHRNGSLSGNEISGGIVGIINSFSGNYTVSSCYVASRVTSRSTTSTDADPIVGSLIGGNSFTSLYYDNSINTTGVNRTGVQGLSTEDMQQASGLTGFDSSVWQFADGSYPDLIVP